MDGDAVPNLWYCQGRYLYSRSNRRGIQRIGLYPRGQLAIELGASAGQAIHAVEADAAWCGGNVHVATDPSANAGLDGREDASRVEPEIVSAIRQGAPRNVEDILWPLPGTLEFNQESVAFATSGAD